MKNMFALLCALIVLAASGSNAASIKPDNNAGLEGIALFILATTKPFKQVSSYESRIVPLAQTWTSALHSSAVYYVFGTNFFDYSYLQKRCLLKRIEGAGVDKSREQLGPLEDNSSADMRLRSSSLNTKNVAYNARGNRRILKPNSVQRKSEDRRLLYSCDYAYFLSNAHLSATEVIKNHKQQSAVPLEPGVGLKYDSTARQSSNLDSRQTAVRRPNTVNALFTANCTGEYFGHGPACRYQESMRFFYYHQEDLFAKTEWFIFIDDDLYMRPYSLQTLLNALSLQSAHHARVGVKMPVPNEDSVHPIRRSPISSTLPLAIISSEVPRGFEFSKKWDRKRFNCKIAGIHDLYLSMPVMLNIAAMKLLRAAIDANSVTIAQNKWGGTHDMLVGLLLWMHSIPTFSIARTYFGGRAYAETADYYSFEPRLHFCVHSIKNLQVVHTDQMRKQILTMFSMYDAAIAFQDCEAGEFSYNVCEIYDRSNATHRISTGGGVVDLQAQAKHPELTQISQYTSRSAMIQQQVEIGLKAFENLIHLPYSHINVTVFATKAKTLSSKFVHFEPEHCQLQTGLVPETDIKQISTSTWLYQPALAKAKGFMLAFDGG